GPGGPTPATGGGAAGVPAGSCTAAPCEADKNQSVTFTASAAPARHRFAGSGGDAVCQGNLPTLTLTVSAPTSCKALYVVRVQVTGKVQAGLGGAVAASSPMASASCAGATCIVDAGDTVTLLAPTVPGFRVSSWMGDGCAAGTMAGQGLTIKPTGADLTCTALYVAGVSVSGTVVGAEGTVG